MQRPANNLPEAGGFSVFFFNSELGLLKTLYSYFWLKASRF
jgi:hypothetical protein